MTSYPELCAQQTPPLELFWGADEGRLPLGFHVNMLFAGVCGLVLFQLLPAECLGLPAWGRGLLSLNRASYSRDDSG